MRTALQIAGIILIAIVIATAVVLGFAALEAHLEIKKDETAKAEFLEHMKKCDGKCRIISVDRAHGERERYSYACDECGSVFMLYDNSIAQEVLYAEKKN